MTDEQKIAALRQEYLDLMHGVQSGVAHELALYPSTASPKHVRVGINSAMVTDAAVGRLLIAKGVVTELEYAEALRDAARDERDAYEARHPGITFR